MAVVTKKSIFCVSFTKDKGVKRGNDFWLSCAHIYKMVSTFYYSILTFDKVFPPSFIRIGCNLLNSNVSGILIARLRSASK